MRFSKGFTLIEVIITLVIMAIAAAAFVTYFGRSFTGSAMQAGQVQRQYQLIQNMEEITSQYRNEVNAGMSPARWTAFKTYCAGRGTCSPETTIGTYNTAMENLQVTCSDGEQTVFAIFTQ